MEFSLGVRSPIFVRKHTAERAIGVSISSFWERVQQVSLMCLTRFLYTLSVTLYKSLQLTIISQ